MAVHSVEQTVAARQLDQYFSRDCSTGPMDCNPNGRSDDICLVRANATLHLLGRNTWAKLVSLCFQDSATATPASNPAALVVRQVDEVF
jgi:hypothetical protein